MSNVENKPRENGPGILLMIGGALCFGTEGLLITVINQRFGLSSGTISLLRQGIQGILVVIFLVLFRREYLKIRLKDLPLLVVMGLSFEALGMVAYTQAILMNGVAITTILGQTSPVWVNLYAILAWHEKPSRSRWLMLAGCLFGVVLVAGLFQPGEIHLNAGGIALGLLVGLLMAGFFLLGGRAVSLYPVPTVIAYVMLFGVIGLAFFQPLPEVAQAIQSPRAMAWLLLLGIGPGLIGSLCFFYGFRLLHAGIGSLVAGAMEPVLAALLAFLILGERMTWLQITGMLLIIGCVMVLSFSKVDQAAQ